MFKNYLDLLFLVLAISGQVIFLLPIFFLHYHLNKNLFTEPYIDKILLQEFHELVIEHPTAIQWLKDGFCITLVGVIGLFVLKYFF